MNITPKMLADSCRKGIGWAPKAMMQSKLLTESKRLLIFDPQSIADISLDWGFNETSSFIRFLSVNAGITPKEFRVNNMIKELNE